MTKDLASGEILKSFFTNFKPADYNLITEHLKLDEASRVKEEEINFLKEVGLKGENITSIAGKNAKLVFSTVVLLCEHRASINKLLRCPVSSKEPVFTAGNLSSILYGAKFQVGNALSQLASDKSLDNINKLKGLDFTAGNLSSIIHDAKSGAGDALSELTSEESLDNIRKLNGLDFTAANLSRILCGTRQDVGNVLSELTSEEGLDNIYKLQQLEFTAENISRMLYNVGLQAKKALSQLASEKSLNIIKQLKDLNYTPEKISIEVGTKCKGLKAVDTLSKLLNKSNNDILKEDIIEKTTEDDVGTTLEPLKTSQNQNDLDENQSQDHSSEITDEPLFRFFNLSQIQSFQEATIDTLLRVFEESEIQDLTKLTDEDIKKLVTPETSQNQNDLNENQLKNNLPDITKKSSTTNNKRELPSPNPNQPDANTINKNKQRKI